MSTYIIQQNLFLSSYLKSLKERGHWTIGRQIRKGIHLEEVVIECALHTSTGSALCPKVEVRVVDAADLASCCALRTKPMAALRRMDAAAAP